MSLTAAGRTAVDAAIADLLAAERDILAGSPAASRTARRLLRRLILGLGD